MPRTRRGRRFPTLSNPHDRKKRLHLQPLEDRLALAIPAGFTETLFTTNVNLSSPTAMEFSPVGELWVLEQSGNVRLVRSDGTAVTAIDLAVDSAGERGLLGIAFDPSYDGTGPNTDYVFLYYTDPANTGDAANNRLSRFIISGAGTISPSISLASEVFIRELPPETEDGDTNHNGGAIHFGPDGKLYAAVGDHNYDTTPQSSHVSQILTSPFGKILRMNPDGTNPTDNPFYAGSASDWQGSIWAMGLRNPYTFAFNPDDGTMYINDVGESAWEEINEGVAGANYGWAGSSSPLWEGFENDGTPPPWTNYHDPVMAYDGVAITGGAFYPDGGPFGAAYEGKYFFSDFGSNFIRLFDPANPGSVATPNTSSAFVSSPAAGSPVDLKVDANGSLFYLARSGGEVYRITRNAATEIEGRHVFYNQSAHDSNSASLNVSDDDAIATDKSAYLPGSGAATFANITSYTRGINGVMVDLSVTHAALTLADFSFKMGANNAPGSWTAAPAPASFTVRPGGGAGGSDRIVFSWADGALDNTWLQVTVEGNDATGGFNTNTGLASSDVFYFGNRVGDAGSGTATLAVTSAVDELAARNNPGAGATVTNLFDYDRSGVVNATDALASRNNAGTLVKINLAPPPAPVADSAIAWALAIAGASSDAQATPATADVPASPSAAPPPRATAIVNDAADLPPLVDETESAAELSLDEELLDALAGDSA